MRVLMISHVLVSFAKQVVTTQDVPEKMNA